jgi:hypothetical protein
MQSTPKNQGKLRKAGAYRLFLLGERYENRSIGYQSVSGAECEYRTRNIEYRTPKWNAERQKSKGRKLNANIEQAPIAIGGISNTEVECRNAN